MILQLVHRAELICRTSFTVNPMSMFSAQVNHPGNILGKTGTPMEPVLHYPGRHGAELSTSSANVRERGSYREVMLENFRA